MRKLTKIMIVVGLILTQFLFSTDLNKVINIKEEKQVMAGGVELPEMPKVKNEVVPGNNAEVSNATEFIAAYTNENIRNITFTADITLTEEESNTVSNYNVVRDLKIDGKGFRYTTNSRSSNFILRVPRDASGITFHIANMIINRQEKSRALIWDDGIGFQGGPGSDIIIADKDKNDIIVENISEIGSNDYSYVFVSTRASNLFVRGNMKTNKVEHNISVGFYNIIFEPNSNSTIANDYKSAFEGIWGNIYIGDNSKVNFNSFEGYNIFNGFKEINIYNNADVFLKSNTIMGVIQGSDKNPSSMIFRVDSGAKLKVENTGGTAIMDSNKKLEIYSNPGAIVEFNGTSTTGTINFINKDSKMVIDSPKYFDIRNMDTSSTVFNGAEGDQQLQIHNATIGLWEKGSPNLNVNPVLPSPFFDDNGNAKKVNLITGNTVMDVSSSAEFNNMPGGYSTDKYNRIATSVKPIFNVSDLAMDIADAPKVIIKNLVEPVSVTWSYSGYDTSLINIDNNGVVTPLKVGTTDVNVTATGTDNYSTTKTVKVRVMDLPTMAVNPPTVFLPLNSTNIDYYSGVSAVDSRGNTLTVTKTGDVDTTVSGIYPITYSATDELNQTATAKRNYVIGNNVIEGNYTIFANDFTKQISEVDTSDEAIKTASDVKVFDNTTGLQVPNNTLTYTINKGGYTSVVGEYPITLSTNIDGTNLSIEVTGRVVSGNIPILSGVETKSVELNKPFNLMDGVSAVDTEDGNITDKIKVSGTVNTSVAGVYPLIYSVTDSDNNTVTATRSIVVNDGSYVIDGIYAIAAYDFKINEDLFNASDEELIKLAKVKVYNLTTGIEVNNPVIDVDSSGLSNKIGEYSITFSFNPKITVTASVMPGSPKLPATGSENKVIYLLLISMISLSLYKRRR